MTTISIKPGALIKDIKPEILMGLIIVNSVLTKYNVNLVVTEGTGGHHMVDSLHYKGLAIDIRSNEIPSEALKHTILLECQAALGKNFDMILEADHIHLEFDPK